MSGKPMAGCGPYLINRPESEPDGAIPYKPPSPELVEAPDCFRLVEVPSPLAVLVARLQRELACGPRLVPYTGHINRWEP